MKLFQAVANADILKAFYERTKIKLDALVSYPYLEGQAYKLTKEYRKMIGLLYLDSGAFSVSTGRSTISVSEYSAYINRYGHLFDEVFNLDDDFEDPDHNLENFLYLSQHLPPKRKKPIPVVHNIKDPFGEFESYVELGCDYVAIGSNKKLKDDVFKKIKDKYPDARLHMFGTLDRKMLMTHRPYSADSASYARAAAMGTIFYWHPSEKRRGTRFMLENGIRVISKFLTSGISNTKKSLKSSCPKPLSINIEISWDPRMQSGS